MFCIRKKEEIVSLWTLRKMKQKTIENLSFAAQKKRGREGKGEGIEEGGEGGSRKESVESCDFVS